MKIGCFNALTDNYIWFIEHENQIIVVDPGIANPIIDYIEQHHLTLQAICLTHDHADHVGGVAALVKQFPAPVYGLGKIATHPLKNGETLHFSKKISGKILFTPGHTYTSLCYLMNIEGSKHLFCGDTLFTAGCGRVFTGDFAAMFHSLNQLKELDSNFLVYPGHEYTLKNLRFAQMLEPNNSQITERIQQEEKKWVTLKNTLPATLMIEQKTNPFFRCDDPALVETISKIIHRVVEPGLDCFMQLRELRNNF